MTTLADDLLRSRTIPELRDLVNSLEKDSKAKKTELQHMVGSKYHDFIQSADKIALMKEKSTALEKQIVIFWESNEQLLKKASTILNFSQPELQKSNKSIQQYISLTGKYFYFTYYFYYYLYYHNYFLILISFFIHITFSRFE